VKRAWRWVRARWRRCAAAALLLAFAALNLVAYLHARAMVTWSEPGARTPNPEHLSLVEKVRVLATGVQVPRPTNARTPGDLGLAFETVRFESASGAELEAWLVPADAANDRGVVVACFHGYAAAKASLLERAAVLRDLGCALALVDFSGSGGSSGTGTTIGIREALDAAAATRFARERFGDRALVLFGDSMGSVAVLEAVANHAAATDGLILEGAFDTLAHTTERRFASMGLPSWPFAPLLVFWGGVAAGIDGFDHRPIDDARAVTAPTLMIHAGEDRRIALEEARSVRDALDGWTRFAVVPGAGHSRSFATDPERWRAAVDALLTRVATTR